MQKGLSVAVLAELCRTSKAPQKIFSGCFLILADKGWGVAGIVAEGKNSNLSHWRIKRNGWAVALLWTLLIAASVGWNYRRDKRDFVELAREAARMSYRKDLLYRRWAAIQGGVYVPATPQTPPNQYLSHVPDRDIVTPRGGILTLMNPAYMTRQVYELGQRDGGMAAHITSLNPIRPENKADPWEAEALRSFGKGVNECSAVEIIDDKPVMRLMRPLLTEEACLKCHALQGYKVGDIRGGISVSLPMSPYMTAFRAHAALVLLGHVGLWLLGLAAIGVGAKSTMKHAQKRLRAEEALSNSEERYRAFVANSSEGIFRFEMKQPLPLSLPDEKQIAFFFQHACLAECNDALARMRGFEKAEDILDARVGDLGHFSASCCEELVSAFIRSGHRLMDFEFHGTDKTLWLSVSAIGIIEDGHLVRIWGVQRDVSERKRVEASRERLVHELQTALDEVKTLSGMLPICANCKKIRDDGGYWTGVESYISLHSNAKFTHGICPDCAKKLYPDLAE